MDVFVTRERGSHAKIQWEEGKVCFVLASCEDLGQCGRICFAFPSACKHKFSSDALRISKMGRLTGSPSTNDLPHSPRLNCKGCLDSHEAC
jgi:hypothetical protein